MEKNSKKLKIVISGGGTGGHIYPALAIAQALIEKTGARILYLGGKSSLEERLVTEKGLEFVSFPVRGLSRKSIKIIGDIAFDLRGIKHARRLIREFKPDVFVGTGGFVSGAAAFAAHKEKVPVVLHEQNAFPGLANRFLSRHAAVVCTSFADAASRFPKKARIEMTGLPVRKEILTASRDDAYNYFEFTEDGMKDKKILLVTGGSQGAQKLNQTMLKAYPQLLEDGLVVIHITGSRNFDEYKTSLTAAGIFGHPNLILLPYLDRMEYGLAAADLVLGRAGASFLAELMARGLPSVLVPYPHAAADHQTYNAQALVNKKAALIIKDEALNEQILLSALLTVLQDDGKRKSMGQNAGKMSDPQSLDKIIELVLAAAIKA